MRTVSIMQPYFLPYLGCFQLMVVSDTFIIYDEIEYTKKGWINRNRFLSNGKDEYFTIPLKKDSDYLPVNQRFLADDAGVQIEKTVRKIRESYRKAPQFQEVFPVIESIFLSKEKNLFTFIFQSLKTLHAFLQLKSNLVVSSTLPVSSDLRGQEKVIALSKAVQADRYVNPIGGTALYDDDAFMNAGLELRFQRPALQTYNQFGNEFIPGLSILDVMMFNNLEEIRQMHLPSYTLLRKNEI